jgi:hypothetical protein
MSVPRSVCWDCKQLSVTVACRPLRYDDGRLRCRPCMETRVESIRAYWITAGLAYSTTPGRGGYGTRELVTEGGRL